MVLSVLGTQWASVWGLQGRESGEGSWGHGRTKGTLLWWVRGTVKKYLGKKGVSTGPPPRADIQPSDLRTQLQPLEGTVPS